MSGSQNSGPGYECNLVSELFVFTGNSMNPSRKHLLKCKRQGELIHTLNLAQRKRFLFHSPKGMLTRFCGESDKFNKCRRLSFSRISYVQAHTLAHVLGGDGEESSSNIKELQRQNWHQKSETQPASQLEQILTRHRTSLIWFSYLFMWCLTFKLLQTAFRKQKISLRTGVTCDCHSHLK